jgi:hypothetical protein
MRELCGALLLICASLLPALASEPVGDQVGRIESTLVRGERDAALSASTATRPAPAQIARVRDAGTLPAWALAELHATPSWQSFAADGGEHDRRPAACVRCDRYRPRSDCGDHA